MRIRGREEREKQENKKGLWTVEEDNILMDYVVTHGTGQWNRIARKTGLKRCGKSCRLRWMNYLSPNVKKGNFTKQEEDLIVRLHKLLGNRWSLIAKRVPGRTDNQVKNYWNSHLSKNFVEDYSSAMKSTEENDSPPSLFITTATTSSCHYPQDNFCINATTSKSKTGDLTQGNLISTTSNGPSNRLWLQEDEDIELSSLFMADYACSDIGYCL